MPNKENIRQWVDALRSGEYPQTTGYLNVTDSDLAAHPVGYCCLGVACEIAGAPKVSINFGGTQITRTRYLNGEGDAFGDTSVLPRTVAEWLFEDETMVDPAISRDVLESALGTEMVENHWTDDYDLGPSLAILNDDWGLNFDQIADIIERTYLAD